MKNLLTVFTILTITFTSAFANNIPEVLINSDEVDVVTVEALDFLTQASFDADNHNIIFETTKDMSFVQIFNAAGELEFHLPVMSKNVQINKNLFEQGHYKLGFILEGQTLVHFTTVIIK